LKLHLIYNQTQYDTNQTCIESFQSIYQEAFPDPNEREDWNDIQTRICQPDAFPKTFVVFDKDAQTNGGLVADFYPQIGVIHLIYIAVSKKSRGQGIAKKLIV
jgi:ribosomal protein S18 acetylase RimI-like enzyme